ncbi:hypothetical protein BpHYR1_008820 [Brachionus plicatilis]|uniref:Uncharacterized protein n=1 Tax=Brachionus plicatilis TaxID=10195 RepID=A0A3M7R6N8_BRAPC|nr:hypothetical protein BpHYR1_008820 [Brachionus plicatilis]
MIKVIVVLVFSNEKLIYTWIPKSHPSYSAPNSCSVEVFSNLISKIKINQINYLTCHVKWKNKINLYCLASDTKN